MFGRREFLEWSARTGVGVTSMFAALGALSACTDGDQTVAEPGTAPSAGGGTLKVGVVVPTTGVGKFAGDITERSLRAAQAHIEAERLFPGTRVAYEIVNAPAEQFADGTQRAYAKLVADPDIVGILWCTVIGLEEMRAQVQRDGIPVIAVFADPWSEGLLDPRGPGRPLFQYSLPDRMAHELLLRYAARDRRYASCGLLYDSTLGNMQRDYFEAAARRAGISVAGVEEFKLFTADFGDQLRRMKQHRPESLVLWGVTDSAAVIAKSLAALDAEYVDRPTAKGPGWHPQILGWAGGVGSPTFAELAGDAARPGTVAAWYMGGLVAGPSFRIRDWLRRYVGTFPTGGEDAPANCYWALLEAARRAGSRDRQRTVTELEQLRGRFAGLEFGFGRRHVAITEDELVLVTIERGTGPVHSEPPYRLGREWREVFLPNNPGYVGPTHLVRPTLAANRRAHPEEIELALTEGWGTLCTVRPADRLGAHLELSSACPVH
jgi:hypothetical protein